MSWAEDLALVGTDPDAGARLLLAAAEFMRAGEALPTALADHIAGAFAVAAHKETEAERVAMLGRELGLVRERSGRPKKATVDDARWAEVQVMFSDDLPYSRTAVERAVMQRAGVKERTAAELFKQLRERQAQDNTDQVATLEAWLDAASPEQREVFELTDQMLDQSAAVAVLARFRGRS